GFGSVRAIFNATEDDLKRVPKIGEVKAAEIVRLVTAAYEGEQKHLDADASDDNAACQSLMVAPLVECAGCTRRSGVGRLITSPPRRPVSVPSWPAGST